ncbi:MAG TPA: YebC/PmpR family DNA-binding transcriptional regulator [Victivallales bacterium]|nr:YebC/PmpR family DNA-binding transcriptional regulator [Victivallales bacterium]HRR29356.1 YebC/PmpR family DNA-binding transcriptional regulator [Victivallales bacterium]HRU00584.1 YebC/PmpR family DNA-binding transcriptional regulator [Victivallales bacterium]
MAGHSKWANIKHKKAAADKKKGKIFSRITKEIIVAAKKGTDPASNSRLRHAILAAKEVNMPNANIERAIKKASGEDGSANYEDIVYEGYAPGGVAILVECLTDNRNRTASEVRSTFEKGHGNLAGSGAVAWIFKKKSHFLITGENANEDKLMEITLDAGAEDIECSDNSAHIYAPPEAYEAISKALSDAKIPVTESGITQIPENYCEIKDISTARQVLNLIENLEELEDVQAVYSNFDAPQEIIEQLNSERQ